MTAVKFSLDKVVSGVPENGFIESKISYSSPDPSLGSLTGTIKTPGSNIRLPKSFIISYDKPVKKKLLITKTYIMDEVDTGCFSPGNCESEVGYKNSIDPYDTFQIKLKSKTELLSHPKEISFSFKP